MPDVKSTPFTRHAAIVRPAPGSASLPPPPHAAVTSSEHHKNLPNFRIRLLALVPACAIESAETGTALSVPSSGRPWLEREPPEGQARASIEEVLSGCLHSLCVRFQAFETARLAHALHLDSPRSHNDLAANAPALSSSMLLLEEVRDRTTHLAGIVVAHMLNVVVHSFIAQGVPEPLELKGAVRVIVVGLSTTGSALAKRA